MSSRHVEVEVRTAAYRALSQQRFSGPKRKRAALLETLVPVIRRLSGVCEENALAIAEEAVDRTEFQGIVMASDRADAIAQSVGEAIARGCVMREAALARA